MHYLHLDSTPSTNAYVGAHADTLEAPAMVSARSQTAGRGQRGNTWESAPGENLTVSVLLRPEGVEARRQFSISEAVALAVTDTLARYGIGAKVKWPNDIYVGDLKICGILIEHSLYGPDIRRTIAGIGLNVNQTLFLSDAPNPVSMRALTGREYDLEEVEQVLGDSIEARMRIIATEQGRERTHGEFMARLWRGRGEWEWRRPDGGRFRGSISSISELGMLTLRHAAPPHQEETFAFKEIHPVF